MPEETTPTTPDAAAAAAASTEAPPADGALSAEQEAQHQSWLDTLDPKTAGEIRRLRDESAKYRTELRTYEEPFKGYDDESRGVWFRLAETYKTDPEAAAKAMKEIADGVLTPEQAATQAEATAGEPAYVTADVLEKKLEERERAAQTKEEVQKLQTEAKALGYEPGTSKYYYLLHLSQSAGGDLSKAHEAIVAEKQANIDEYVKGLQDDANGNIAPVTGGGAPSGEKPIKTWAEARESMEQRLAQL